MRFDDLSDAFTGCEDGFCGNYTDEEPSRKKINPNNRNTTLSTMEDYAIGFSIAEISHSCHPGPRISSDSFIVISNEFDSSMLTNSHEEYFPLKNPLSHFKSSPYLCYQSSNLEENSCDFVAEFLKSHTHKFFSDSHMKTCDTKKPRRVSWC